MTRIEPVVVLLGAASLIVSILAVTVVVYPDSEFIGNPQEQRVALGPKIPSARPSSSVSTQIRTINLPSGEKFVSFIAADGHQVINPFSYILTEDAEPGHKPRLLKVRDGTDNIVVYIQEH